MTKDQVAELIESIKEPLSPEDFLVALATKAEEAEREACALICLHGTDMPVQVDALKMMKAERKRILKAILARGKE